VGPLKVDGGADFTTSLPPFLSDLSLPA
jgi:hypothetical protein